MPQAFNGHLPASLMDPGIYEDFDEDSYHKDPALGSSDIKDGFEGNFFNLGKFWARKRGIIPTKDSSGFAVGSVIHYLVLECSEGMIEEEIKKVAVKKPKGMEFRSKDNKAWRDENLAAGKAILTESEWSACLQATGNILQNRVARHLLRGSKNEVSIWDKDFETGIHRKARLDIVAGDGISVGDLKSTKDSAGPSGFNHTFMKYKYFLQAGHYKDTAEAQGLKVMNYFIVAFEKDPPYQVAVHRINDETMKFSVRAHREALKKIQKANEIGIWPGYSMNHYSIGVPEGWIAASYEDGFWERES